MNVRLNIPVSLPLIFVSATGNREHFPLRHPQFTPTISQMETALLLYTDHHETLCYAAEGSELSHVLRTIILGYALSVPFSHSVYIVAVLSADTICSVLLSDFVPSSCPSLIDHDVFIAIRAL
jgi:hypothetical protein